MLFDLVESFVDVLERFRRFSLAQWVLRGAVALSGAVAAIVLWSRLDSPVLLAATVVALLLALIFPRGHVPTAVCGVIFLWALISGSAPVWWYGIVALGCLGVHWASAACAVGPSFAVVDSQVWLRLARPAWWALGGIVVAVALTAALQLVTLPASLVLVACTVALVISAGLVTVWPMAEPERSSP